MMNEQTVLSSPDSFVTVRHLTIRGSNFQIGRKIGELARERYARSPDQFRGNPLFARARRIFFQRNYPFHWERLRGVASAFELDPDDDRYDLTGPTYLIDLPASVGGCSVVYYPPTSTTSKHGYLSRNYDFFISSLPELMQLTVPPDFKARPIMSEPYVMSWYPEDGGYASIAVHAFDMLAGTHA